MFLAAAFCSWISFGKYYAICGLIAGTTGTKLAEDLVPRPSSSELFELG